MVIVGSCVSCCQQSSQDIETAAHVTAIEVSDTFQDTVVEEMSKEEIDMDVSQAALQSMELRRVQLAKSESAISPESLSVNLRDYSLLRGTSLRHILHRCGRELSMSSLASSCYTPDQAATLYNKSRKVNRLDFFISHCWRDDRFGKILALWIHSNLRFAMAASAGVAVICGVLARVDILPRLEPEYNVKFFPWGLYLGSAVFFLALIFSHHLHGRVWDRKYFLDKFCIHQTDLELKQRGVISFAAFVASADRVLVLWSPQYFTRLWCTLELAALVKASGDQPLPLDFMPLQLAKVSFVGWIVVAVVLCIVQTNRLLSRPIPDIIFICGLMCVFSYLFVTTLRQYGRDRQALEQQLRTFAVQEAECYSDSDRRSVEKALLRWFANLDLCNQHIREGVSDQVLQALGREVHYPTLMLLPMLLINLFSEADYIAGHYYDEETLDRLATLVGWSACMLALVPLCYRLCYFFCEKRRFRCGEVLINVFLSLLVALLWMTAYAVNFYLVNANVLSGWLLPLPVLEWMAFFYLQRDAFWCGKGRGG